MKMGLPTIQDWAAPLAVEPRSIDTGAPRSEPGEGTMLGVVPRTAAFHRETTASAGSESMVVLQFQQRVAQSASGLAGHLDDAEPAAELFEPRGWFGTGGLGRWENDSLVVTGRLKELIITDIMITTPREVTMITTPREVEIVVEEFPVVAEASVSGLRSQRSGEGITAWIAPSGDGPAFEPDAVTTRCRTLLASFKCPKRVFCVARLLRDAMSRIVRRQLSASV